LVAAHIADVRFILKTGTGQTEKNRSQVQVTLGVMRKALETSWLPKANKMQTQRTILGDGQKNAYVDGAI